MNKHIGTILGGRINKFSKDVEEIKGESNNEAALLNGFAVILIVGLSYSLYHEVAYGNFLVELETILGLGAITYLLSLRFYQDR